MTVHSIWYWTYPVNSFPPLLLTIKKTPGALYTNIKIHILSNLNSDELAPQVFMFNP